MTKWGCAAFVAWAWITTSGARAQVEDDNARARGHYERGISLYDEGQFDGALAEFEAAYALSHRASLLFNIGQIHARLGHAVEATENLERYLTEVPDMTPDRRAAVESELATQRGRIARVTVQTVEGARVSIDDVERGTAPLEAPLLVGAGEHLLLVVAEGHEASRTRFRIAGGEARTIEAELVRVGALGGPTGSEASSSPTPVLTITGAVIGGAGLVTWAVAGGLTLAEDARLGSLCATQPCTESDTATIAASRIAADVGLGVLVAGGVLAIVGALTELGGSSEPRAGDVALGARGVEVWW